MLDNIKIIKKHKKMKNMEENTTYRGWPQKLTQYKKLFD